MNCIKFLREHPNLCDCGICFSAETNLLRFFTAVIYARYVYLDEESSSKAKQTIFKQLLAYWEDNRSDKSKFPRNDMFYMMSARMLLFMGHFCWKYENNKDTAVTLLKRGSKGLNRVKHGAFLIKQDLELQIKSMDETIKEMQAPIEKKYLRNKGSFDEQPVIISWKSTGSGATDFTTPKVNKNPRIRSRKADEVPARTPSQPAKQREINSISKPAGRTKWLPTPTIFIDLDSDSESAKETK